MIRYMDLGAQKKLNEIVMIGSHDAAITSGRQNIQTQALNIGEQAEAGVRIFDLRITGAVVSKGGAGTVAQLKAFHGHASKVKGDAIDLRTGQTGRMTTQDMSGKTGGWGQSLSSILDQARNFVTANGSEFLILKFDKCTNWQMIADACLEMLGGSLYTNSGNLNLKTLQELAGKVVVVFGPDAWKEGLSPSYLGKGILKFVNLSKSGGYQTNFPGLQYVGKGGTDVLPWTKGFYRTFGGKMKENTKKQVKLLEKGAAVDPEVLGMMYWTTTGVFKSIKQRNNFLWNADNQEKLVELWETRLPSNVNPTTTAAAPALKQFMPNFVMVDFADATKCEKIFALNYLTAMNAMNAAVDYYAQN
jgi:hypothetical protein